MSILSITNLSHRYEDKVLFDGVDLQVNNYEHIGVVGLNGAGKSTFMNILTGEVMHDGGEVKWLKGIRYGYLDQHADIDRSLTVMEYLRTTYSELYQANATMEQLYHDMATESDPQKSDRMLHQATNILDRLTAAGFFEIDSEIKKVANGLGIQAVGYDTLIAHLSGGQRAKVMLSKLLLQDLDVLLLDEPTNFLDLEHIAWLADFLKKYKGAFILVSHDTDFLDKVCEIIVSLSNRQIKKYTGNYTQFLSQFEMNERQYADEYNRRQAEIQKLEDYIARNKARASTAGMANSRQKRLDKIVELEKPITIEKPTFSFPYVLISANEILHVSDLLIGYGAPLLPPINLTLKNGDRLWIRGTNGIGKTTLLKTITGNLRALGGTVEFNVNVRTGYVEQELSFTNREQNAIGYMSDTFARLSQRQIRTMLGGVGLKQELATRGIEFLSGGEQMRLKLCAQMNRPSNLLILDEPTNHLDVKAKEALHEALQEYEGSIILVSHEPSFCNSLCNRIYDVV